MRIHGVDLKDHLSYSHNNLRFSEKIWGSEIMARSRFYTNRILFEQMRRACIDAGFEVEVINVKKWNAMPVPRSKLAPEFSQLSDDELLTSDFDMILKPA